MTLYNNTTRRGY